MMTTCELWVRIEFHLVSHHIVAMDLYLNNFQNMWSAIGESPPFGSGKFNVQKNSPKIAYLGGKESGLEVANTKDVWLLSNTCMVYQIQKCVEKATHVCK